jgi:hypothetical protein
MVPDMKGGVKFAFRGLHAMPIAAHFANKTI